MIVGGCATAGRAAQQERRHDDAWNQDVTETKTADTRATRYSLYVLHSTLSMWVLTVAWTVQNGSGSGRVWTVNGPGAPESAIGGF